MGAITFSIDEALLDFFVRVLNVEVFVETGTFEGDSLAIASRKVAECHSVELSQTYFDGARERFAGQPNIHLHLGESAAFLRAVAPRIAGRSVLYWLDAHWCAAENTAGQDSQSPILEEIKAIDKLCQSHTLCIDDARLYLCPPPAPHRYTDWPDFYSVITALLRVAPEHRFMVLNDVIIVYPQDFREALERFAFDNGVDWLHLANSELRPQAPKKKFGRRIFRRN